MIIVIKAETISAMNFSRDCRNDRRGYFLWDTYKSKNPMSIPREVSEKKFYVIIHHIPCHSCLLYTEEESC